MKKNIILILVIVLLVLFFVFFSPKKFTKFESGMVPLQYSSVCKGLYIETFNDVALDGGIGGLCFGKVEKVENPKGPCPQGMNSSNTWCDENINSRNSSPTLKPTPTPTPTPLPLASQNYECQSVAGFNCNDYANGWKAVFKKENNLSEAEFNSYITITTVSIKPLGNNYELTVRYVVKKDWFIANQVDSILLGIGSQLKPDQLPTERSVSTSGRTGVSSVDLKSLFSFSNSASAIEYFANIYNQKASKINISQTGFQYFWNIEKDSTAYAGQGGEPYLRLDGEINRAQNKCFTGQVSLINKKTVFREDPCEIFN